MVWFLQTGYVLLNPFLGLGSADSWQDWIRLASSKSAGDHAMLSWLALCRSYWYLEVKMEGARIHSTAFRATRQKTTKVFYVFRTVHRFMSFHPLLGVQSVFGTSCTTTWKTLFLDFLFVLLQVDSIGYCTLLGMEMDRNFCSVCICTAGMQKRMCFATHQRLESLEPFSLTAGGWLAAKMVVRLPWVLVDWQFGWPARRLSHCNRFFFVMALS